MQHTSTGVALVTGTSSGIGLDSAVALAKAGFTVVATMRNLERAEALRTKAREIGVEVDIRKLDITSDAEAQACSAGVLT